MDKEFKDFMKKFQNNFAVGPNMLKMGEKLEEEHAQKKKDLEFYKKWKKLSAVQGTHRQARELALKHGMGDPNNPKIGLLFGANLNKGAYFGNTDQEQLDSLQKEVKDIMKGEENARKFREQMNKPTVQKQSGLTTPDGTSITKIGYNPSVAGLSKSIGMMNWNFMKRMENLPGANKKHDPHTTGYVPGQGMGWGSKSGVTIATGFDLGWQTEKSISSLSSDLRSKLKPFLGKKGTTAYDLLMDSRMRGTGLTITKSQAQEIDQLQFAKYREELSAEATAKKFGFGSHWGDMTSAQKTVAASLRQLYGPKALAKKGYKTMQWLGQGREGSLKAIYELLNPKKWGSHMGRHKEEAKLLLREFLGPRVTPELLTEAMNLIQQENLLAKAPSSDDGFNLINAPTHNVNNSDNKMVVPFGAQDRNYPTLVPA